MRFRFRLEPLLRKAAHTETAAMRRLGEAIQRVAQQEARIAETTARRGEVIHQLELPSNGRIHLAQLASGNRAVLKLRTEIMKQREVLLGLRQEVERRRVELMEATKEKRKLEKLRERLKLRFQDDIRIHEAKEQDEIAGKSDQFRKREDHASGFTSSI